MSRGVRYRVLRKIAHGGMAEIFLALQIGAEGFEKPVVLKRILPALGSDPAFVRMLIDEAHIVSTLNHTHLVQILDLGQVDDQFFLVLEFVDGWSLEQVRRRARKAKLKLPLPLALYITSALCRGLDYVHRRTRNGKPLGIIHRDVTPQNLLLGREGDVKLADFGIAKAIGRREKSATGVIKGKFAYMSPEQTIGAELDARSDLFSVGTLLYLLTTGRKPFDAPTDLDVLMQVRKARHEKPSAFVRDFNPDVERFIERALRADRARRFQSAEQMADKLDSILFEIGKPTGPATLKRWLETLSARDGIAPPGDLLEVSPEPLSGTMQLVSGDLELSHVPPVSPREHQELLSGAVDQELLPGVWATARTPSPLEARDDTATVASVSPEASVGAAREVETEVVRSEELSELPRPASNADDPTVCRALEAREVSDVEGAPRPGDAAEEEATTSEFALHAHSQGATVDQGESAPVAPPDAIELTTRPGETEPALLLPAAGRAELPRRPPRRLRRLAVAALLLPLVLGGGAYVARPYLPEELMPPDVLRVVDRWLMRLSPTLHSLERAGSPSAALDAER